jgi:hypothetical protein
VREVFDKRPEVRNVADLQTTLRDVAIITRASLLDLGEQPRGKRVGRTDDIIGDQDTTPAEIAGARRRLNMAAVDLLTLGESAEGAESPTFLFELEPRRRVEAM